MSRIPVAAPEQRECTVCPPAWLPPTERTPERMVACAHYEGRTVWLFRHGDLSHIHCLAFAYERPSLDQVFTDHAEALAAFHLAEARLLGRADE